MQMLYDGITLGGTAMFVRLQVVRPGTDY
jgi:hypothetical protein